MECNVENLTENILHKTQVDSEQNSKDDCYENISEGENIFDPDICDVLFEAGYSIEEIHQTVKTKSCSSETSSDSDQNETTESDSTDNPVNLLKEFRIKNVNRLIIGTLNINSLASKFEQLKLVMEKSLDVLILQETKLDSSFPAGQFTMEGYSQPYRLDRNRNGGGVMIFVKENIPSKQLNKHTFTETIEGLFIEINLRKTKLLLFGSYRSDNITYGVCPRTFFHQLNLALDTYTTYDKILLAGDFNIEDTDHVLEEFLSEQGMKNLVKENTCFKSIEKPSCIDLLLTNTPHSFQQTKTVTTGLSDFHKMVITVLKTTVPKTEPKIIYYRDYKKFNLLSFRSELRFELRKNLITGYAIFTSFRKACSCKAKNSLWK